MKEITGDDEMFSKLPFKESCGIFFSDVYVYVTF